MDRTDRPPDVLRDPGAGRGGALGDRRRLVGRARLQHPVGRIVRSPGPHLTAVLPGEIRPDRDGRLQRGPVRPPRDASAAPAAERDGRLYLHATRPSRAPAAGTVVLVGIAGRIAGARLPTPTRVLLVPRGSRTPPRQVDRAAPATLDGDDGLLWRREP